ncbi:WapI family immunity protein [Deinococcus pimensis]|uniref:WapI family immunity protein n=1 Tax=Deinococcus pimensis TaxID=309888 RepID=UPI0004AF385E|nr:hypothetical protein [Deinococcus pimensis]
MRLHEGNVTFELDVAGYQFPHLHDDPLDAEWLDVRLRLRVGGHDFTQVDPALTAGELVALTGWLREVALHLPTFAAWRGPTLTTRIDFTEPNLAFEVRGGHPTGAPATLRVCLAAESRPPFHALLDRFPREGDPDEVWVDFALDEEVLKATIGRLEETLRRFPVRTGV